MSADLWVIWIAALVLTGTVASSIGSLYFPSQSRLDAEYEAGRDDEAEDWRKSLAPPPPSPRGELPPAAAWDDTTENLAAFGRSHYTDLASECPSCKSWYADMYPVSESGDSIERCADPWHAAESSPRSAATSSAFPASPIYDQLATELPAPMSSPVGAGHQAPGPESPDSRVRVGTAATRDGDPVAAGPGADPWEHLAAELDDDPDISEWSAKADAARCSEIVRELQQLAKTLGA